MFENVINFLKNLAKKEQKQQVKSKDAAKERLQLVLMQDRANISADFLDLMKQEIIEVIKKYIDVDENAIDVRLTNKANEDGTNGAPSLYANIPIISIKEEVKQGMSRQKDKNNASQETMAEEEISHKEDKNKVEEQQIEQVETNNEEVEKKEKIEENLVLKDENIEIKENEENVEIQNESVEDAKTEEQPTKFSNNKNKKKKHKNKHR